MKDMKISKKLILSYLIVTILCVIVGGTGIFGMSEINNASNDMYESMAKPLPDLAKSLEFIQRLRIQFRNVILFSGNDERLNSIEEEIQDRAAKFEEYTNNYAQTIQSDETKKELYREAMAAYHESFKPALMQIISSARYGAETDTLISIMDRITPAATTIVDNLTECMNINVKMASTANDRNTVLFYTMIGAISLVVLLAVIVSLFFARFISVIISTPIIALTDLMKTAGTTGNINLSDEDLKHIHKLSNRKDEIGECIVSTVDFLSHMIEASKMLEIIAGGDLTAKINLLSENDTIGVSLTKMLGGLNDMFREINSASNQVTGGSRQIADGAQRLSHGSSLQASTVEELTNFISNIAANTQTNAELCNQTATLANTIIQNAEKGNNQMNEMISAVGEINQASQDIKRVIKVIEDIAFQTNILALNAAVEAARAGDHGKGFSVVAEEVRNLASKSALAANDTENLIANSISKAELGVNIAAMTAESLTDIVSGIKESDKLILQISKSSDLQAKGIEQINDGIRKVSDVVQQNHATAEESAAASSEMSYQSNVLKELIARFKTITEV